MGHDSGAQASATDDGAGAVPDGGTPKLKRKDYEKALRKLQTELCILQDWVKSTGQRIVVVFEGRDAAGKGGTIRALTERVSPRTFRLVALPAPSDREKSQMYVQRYLAHFPAAGEIVIFDRSWYNRAGVEHVMGFCTKEQHKLFLEVCPKFEKHITDNGIRLVKYWLEVSNKEQKERFEARVDDPMRQWKLSNMDLPSRERWYDYSRARDKMLEATDTDFAPWYLLHSDDKRRARLNLISHFLGLFPYEASDAEEGQAAHARQVEGLRRRSDHQGPPLDRGKILRSGSGRPRRKPTHTGAARELLVDAHHEGGGEERRQQIEDRHRGKAGDDQAAQRHVAHVRFTQAPRLFGRQMPHGHHLEIFTPQQITVADIEGDQVHAGHEQQQAAR